MLDCQVLKGSDGHVGDSAAVVTCQLTAGGWLLIIRGWLLVDVGFLVGDGCLLLVVGRRSLGVEGWKSLASGWWLFVGSRFLVRGWLVGWLVGC